MTARKEIDLTITVVVGTRPEIIKIAPIIHAFRKLGIDFNLVLTGQHYDYSMSLRFVEELCLPAPFASFQLTNSKPASEIGEIMVKLEPILEQVNTRILMIQGDTNSMLASALTGIKAGVPVAHVEAGLRSYDWRMPEEHNRRMVDHVSDILFAPTERARQNLVEEHVYGRVLVTGNTIVDAVLEYMPYALKNSSIMNSISFPQFCLATFHRKENVDSPQVLAALVDALLQIEYPVVFPVHPRTNARLHEFGLYSKLSASRLVHLLPPVSYFDILVLLKNCEFVMTDSGGLQEEVTAPTIRKPVIVLRSTTERPEAVESGFAQLVEIDKNSIVTSVKQLIAEDHDLPNHSPFGDGHAAERIGRFVLDDLQNPRAGTTDINM